MKKTAHQQNPAPSAAWQQGALVELEIIDLNHQGEGVGRSQGKVIFVPDSVPGDRLLVRLVQVKPQYAQGKLHTILEASPHRIRPRCIVADKCGGCQWQHIDYDYQRQAKRNLIIQDLQRIGGFENPSVDPVLWNEDVPEGSPPADLAYRNKATYPLSRSATGQVQAGYYRKGSHQLVNLNQCPIQDQRLNPILVEVKQDLQQRGWSIYNETQRQGKLRHLGLRIGRHTGEMLITLISTSDKLPGLEEQAQTWLDRYPQLVGVCLNLNPQHTNVIFGAETRCLAGRPYLCEEFARLQFQIHPTTFFQVNTEQAEALLNMIATELDLKGNETLLDAYCGVGTLTLPLAKQAQQAIGIEVQPEAIAQAQINARLNGITNAKFHIGTVEAILPKLEVQPDVVLVDPPRKGCDRTVIEQLLQIQPDRIVYVSCNPATLARDLKLLSTSYQLLRVQPADFFPQTAHVECAAFLKRV
ncbi:MAG: 23S rRNA (uracil(1939)-C(5))-methyltransferase RlmD [Elainellaceae cyanobacterium]